MASEEHVVTLAANQATELEPCAFAPLKQQVIGAQLLVNGTVVSRAALWPEPFKYLTLPDPGLQVGQEGETLRLRVTRPAKGVWLSAGDGVAWRDNMVDLFPGDEQVIVAKGLGTAQVQAHWLH